VKESQRALREREREREREADQRKGKEYKKMK
jgi:hypothetical protein